MLRALLLGLFSLALIAGGLVLYGYFEIQRAGPATQPVTVVIEPGTGLEGIARTLEAANAVDWSWWVVAAAVVPGDERPLLAGEYEIPPGASASAIVRLLRDGKVVVHRLTVPEGMAVAQIMRLVEDTAALSGSLPPMPPEGSLLPETYNFTRGENRSAMIDRMRRAMAGTLAQAWEKRSPDLPFTTPEEALVLASIIEKETARDSERRRIAGVFVNRLNRGMRLQSDPTVIYGITSGARGLGRGLTRSELDTATPYNTYTIPGLPPGPIASPGQDSIEAAVNPLKTNDLYFVADGSGGHAFAATLDEHNRNVKKWRDLQAAKGN
ncbi:endolytic transglycosylase MltG [Oleomonas cavernae]|uniref:Endolytic murein transglycosylase n=1 Tax=Oleomonas cavernae TaxID=2320859 RepID=A0A418WA60_9PROT|nr:endolytic transglycosylase MltG [Oleomonas cavernae]RJF86902.1 endolytic transglycosylase MltG [Oleomonas cavernae]